LDKGIFWNFDDGDFENLSFDKNPLHTFYNARTFNVRLEITSIEGCKKDTIIGITAFPVPEANFRANTTTVTMASPLVYFTNYSDGGFWFYWNFGDGVSSTTTNPNHAYTLPGVYTVNLHTTSLYGCTDSISVDIHVNNELAVYAPTAFTPNHDEMNETFKVFVDGMDITTYRLNVYNRWGEVVFFTEDYNQEWNGRHGDIVCTEGVYKWVITFVDLYGNEHFKSGNVTLLR
jgi:gliding motility-associated-like protein